MHNVRMHKGFDPTSLPVDRRYALLIGSIVPRPIAVVGTCAPDGSEPNLAPFSFYAGAGSDPMCLLFCPARFAESPIAFECRTLQVIRTNPGKPSGGNIVIGEVVWVHADPAIIDERLRIDPERLQAVGRMGGMEYTHTRDRFALPWGAAALR